MTLRPEPKSTAKRHDRRHRGVDMLFLRWLIQLSGDQNNPKNLFTQSAYSNQNIQTIFEAKVRRALRQNKRVIYQATAVFRGNELMARGVNLQAV